MTIVAQLPHTTAKPILARLRVETEVSIARAEGSLWLRAEGPEPSCVQALQALPWLGLFERIAEDKLVPLGSRLPTDSLPSCLRWQRLRDWLVPAPISPCLPGIIDTNAQQALRLIRCTALDQTANVLITDMNALHAYTDHAPLTRLLRLRFAAAGDGRVVILGLPLLPLQGQFHHCQQRMILPLGYRLGPSLSDEALTEILALAPTELALFHLDDSFERLRQDDFLQLTRSAVRLTSARFTIEASTSG
jgi:hypothetical protein